MSRSRAPCSSASSHLHGASGRFARPRCRGRPGPNTPWGQRSRMALRGPKPMLFSGILIVLILVLVAACGVRLSRVYAWPDAPPVAADQVVDLSAPRSFADALTALLNAQLRDIADPAIRFALQSRIDAAILMADSSRSLALLEAFFDLE